MDREQDHQRRIATLTSEIEQARTRGQRIGLRKSTSNLFRQRSPAGKHLIDVRAFNRVLAIDLQRMTADVEGMITYEAPSRRDVEVWTAASRGPATQDDHRRRGGQRTRDRIFIL